MINFLRRFFGLREKIIFVEVSPELPISDEARAAITRLPEHPGFQTLMTLLRRQRAAISTALHTCKPEDLIRLQEARRAMGWLEAFVNHECRIKESKRKEVDVSERERQILAASLANIAEV